MWELLRVVAILGWLFGLTGAVIFGLPAARVVLIVMVAVHTSEIPLGLYLARRRGHPPVDAVIRTFLYGLLFWVPILILDHNQKGEKR